MYLVKKKKGSREIVNLKAEFRRLRQLIRDAVGFEPVGYIAFVYEINLYKLMRTFQPSREKMVRGLD